MKVLVFNFYAGFPGGFFLGGGGSFRRSPPLKGPSENPTMSK